MIIQDGHIPCEALPNTLLFPHGIALFPPSEVEEDHSSYIFWPFFFLAKER